MAVTSADQCNTLCGTVLQSFTGCATAGTFKEILSIATDTTQKDVARSFNIINKNMGDKWGAAQPTTHVKDFMRRFCNQLGLKHQDVVVAEEFALAACPRDGRWVASPGVYGFCIAG